MEYRNAHFTADGFIDCELNHPVYSWISFTCDKADTGAAFDTAALFDTMEKTARPYIAPVIDPAEMLARARVAINAERDRRMTSTFAFAGKVFDCDQASLARITGAATLAGFAIAAGAPSGFMRWHEGDADFAWIDADNNLFPMDALTCFAFGQAAANNQSAHIFAAKALKTMDPIPADYTADKWWP